MVVSSLRRTRETDPVLSGVSKMTGENPVTETLGSFYRSVVQLSTPLLWLGRKSGVGKLRRVVFVVRVHPLAVLRGVGSGADYVVVL